MADEFPGIIPPTPPWGQEKVIPSPDLKRRIKADPAAEDEIAVVLGAGGALGPEFLNALVLRGTGVVVGIDVSLTYVCDGVTYRKVDLLDRESVLQFFRDLRAWAKAKGLKLATIYDLSTVQTSPVSEKDIDRDSLENSKGFLIEALCEGEGDVRLFYMSSGEVYGAPEGAPYKEEHIKQPFNDYGRAKWHEEQKVLSYHGRLTKSGKLYATTLRTWTIAMVNYDKAGNIICSRNYNDPLVMIIYNLTRAGIKTPLVDPGLKCQFHPAEEVAEVSLLLGTAPLDVAIWGKAHNCVGLPATHGELRDIAMKIFKENEVARSWWALLVKLLIGHGKLPKFLLSGTAYVLERLGGILDARDVGGRLPFLYRDTHMDNTALTEALAHKLIVPGGSTSAEAVKRLATGILNGGEEALIFRRYRNY